MSTRYPIDGSQDALWMATAVPAPATTSLTGKQKHYDAIVVGAGFTGLNAALSLAEQGKAVCVLEAEGLGFGASGRSGGQVNMGLNLGPSALIDKFGRDTGERLINLVTSVPERVFKTISENRLDCDPVQTGWVQGAVNKHFLNAQLKALSEYTQYGSHQSTLDASEIEEKTGSRAFIGGIFNPKAGSLHPLSYTRELARVCIEHRVDIFTHSRVQQLQQSSAGWTLLCDAGQVSADQVMICSNGYTDKLVKGLAQKIVPVRSILVATEPLSEDLRQQILPNAVTLVDKRRLILYFRYDRFGRLCIGDHGPMRDHFTLNDFDQLKKRVLDVFPQLKQVGWEFHWGGRIAMTQDSLPFIEQLAEGLWAGMGYNGRGVGMGSVMGNVLGQIVGGLPLDESPVPISVPNKYALHALHKPGVYLNIKWFELNDYLRKKLTD